MTPILSQHIQDSYLKLVITDTDFLAMTIGQISPNIFTTDLTSNLVKICHTYYAAFKESPGQQD